MTSRNSLILSAGVLAALLAGISTWLQLIADDSTKAVIVLGGALSILSVTGMVVTGEAKFSVPHLSKPAAAGVLVVMALTGVAAAAVVVLVDSSDATIVTRNRPVAGPTGDAAANDSERLRELALIYDALREMRELEGSFPSTSGNLQTACNYPVDKLCALEAKLGKDAFIDPRGEPGRYGYWYQSNGTTFTLLASMENAVTGEGACPSELQQHLHSEGVKNVFCVGSP